MSDIKLFCSKCGTKIKDDCYKSLDVGLQLNYFDHDKDNCFCSKKCFCEYMSLEQVDKTFYLSDSERGFIDNLHKTALEGTSDIIPKCILNAININVSEGCSNPQK